VNDERHLEIDPERRDLAVDDPHLLLHHPRGLDVVDGEPAFAMPRRIASSKLSSDSADLDPAGSRPDPERRGSALRELSALRRTNRPSGNYATLDHA
jgi:hypothetical protein